MTWDIPTAALVAVAVALLGTAWRAVVLLRRVADKVALDARQRRATVQLEEARAAHAHREAGLQQPQSHVFQRNGRRVRDPWSREKGTDAMALRSRRLAMHLSALTEKTQKAVSLCDEARWADARYELGRLRAHVTGLEKEFGSDDVLTAANPSQQERIEA